jgi:hypothetical protein
VSPLTYHTAPGRQLDCWIDKHRAIGACGEECARRGERRDLTLTEVVLAMHPRDGVFLRLKVLRAVVGHSAEKISLWVGSCLSSA